MFGSDSDIDIQEVKGQKRLKIMASDSEEEDVFKHKENFGKAKSESSSKISTPWRGLNADLGQADEKPKAVQSFSDDFADVVQQSTGKLDISTVITIICI